MVGANRNAWQQGFVTSYAMSESREDFVENIAVYVTNTEDYWNNMLQNAGESGSALIKQKFEIVYTMSYRRSFETERSRVSERLFSGTSFKSPFHKSSILSTADYPSGISDPSAMKSPSSASIFPL